MNSASMTIKHIGDLPPFFDRYITKVDPEKSLREAFEMYSPAKLLEPLLPQLIELADDVYAPEKWTIKQMLQHCIDTERIMGYRALAFARGDTNNLPGFDENEYAKNANLEGLDVKILIDEFDIVRGCNVLMLRKFTETELLRMGKANNINISPLALGFVLVGHLMHHVDVIKERYLSLLKK